MESMKSSGKLIDVEGLHGVEEVLGLHFGLQLNRSLLSDVESELGRMVSGKIACEDTSEWFWRKSTFS